MSLLLQRLLDLQRETTLKIIFLNIIIPTTTTNTTTVEDGNALREPIRKI